MVSGQSSGESPEIPYTVDRWIHTLKSRWSLTRIPIMEFKYLNDEESWSRCILKSQIPKPRKDPYRWIRGGLRPSISLWREIFHSLALSGFDISLFRFSRFVESKELTRLYRWVAKCDKVPSCLVGGHNQRSHRGGKRKELACAKPRRTSRISII